MTITDENDNRPVFSEDGYTAVVAENAPPGTPVVAVTASDRDQGDSGLVRYSIVDASNAEGRGRGREEGWGGGILEGDPGSFQDVLIVCVRFTSKPCCEVVFAICFFMLFVLFLFVYMTV